MSQEYPNAVKQCINKGHHPYLAIGHPTDTEQPYKMTQMITEANGRVVCIDREGKYEEHPKDWCIAFVCSLCLDDEN